MLPGPTAARAWTAAWCLLLAAAAFFPFELAYRGPERVATGLVRDGTGGVRFVGPAVLRTRGAPIWVREALAAEQLTLLVVARSAGPEQSGPARLVTLSRDARARNLTVGQQGEDLVVRCRRPGADRNGAPPLKVDGVFRAPAWVTIEVRITAHEAEVLVDGRRRARETFEEPVFARWDPDMRLGLGDEVDGARGWLGSLRTVAVAVGDEVFDVLADPDLEAPAHLWYMPEPTRQLLRFDPSWAVVVEGIHLVAFLPLGALLALGSLRGRPLWRIALAAALFGAIVQLGKLGFEGRHPSLYHALPNGVGAALGAAWVRRRTGVT